MTPSDITTTATDSLGRLERRRRLTSYVERPQIDGQVKAALDAGKHLVIFGNSDAGKTAMVRHHLAGRQYVVVQCSPKMRLYDIYRLALSEAKIGITLHERRKRSKSQTATVSIVSDREADLAEEVSVSPQIDLSNVRDVVRLLEQQTKVEVVVIEDFHNLRWKIQKELAQDLKVVFETSAVTFVVLGVWGEVDRLNLLCGDVVGRTLLLSAGQWQAGDLEAVLRRQEQQAGVQFPDRVRAGLIEAALGNVGILLAICERAIVHLTAKGAESGALASPSGAAAFVQRAVREMLTEHMSLFDFFVTRFWRRQNETKAEVATAIMSQLLKGDVSAPQFGISLQTLLAPLATRYADAPKRMEELTSVAEKVLSNIEEFQRKRGVRPPILTYDRREEFLRVIDVRFFLFLRFGKISSQVKRLEAELGLRHQRWKEKVAAAAAAAQRGSQQAKSAMIAQTAPAALGGQPLPLSQSPQTLTPRRRDPSPPPGPRPVPGPARRRSRGGGRRPVTAGE